MEFNFNKLIFLILASLLLSCSNDDGIDPKNTADLSIAVAASTTSPIANTNLTFTLIATNKGPLDATEVEVSNKILSGYTFVSADPSSGTYDEETGIWTIGDFTNGATAMLIIKVKVNETGEYNNKASISGDQADIVKANNEIISEITVKTLTDDLLYTYTLSEGPNPEVTITGLSQLWKDLTNSSKLDLTIPANIEGHPVTIIGYAAFEDQYEILSVTIPNGVRTISSNAFDRCYALKSISLPNSVTVLDSFAFSSCYALTTINIPNNLISIGSYAFYLCESLKTITISNSVTKIETRAFYGCVGLTSVILPNALNKIETEIFAGCSALSGIIIPNTVKSIGVSAFYDCDSLISIAIPGSVTSIGNNAFYSCNALTSITVEVSNPSFIVVDGVLYDKNINTLLFCLNSKTGSFTIPNTVTEIGNLAFALCKNLTSITIPNSVITIKSNAFRYCTGLTTIIIPSSVKTIEFHAFSDNPNLKSVIMNPLVPPVIESNTNLTPFVNCTNLTGSGAIKVPAVSLSAYKSGWSFFADIIGVQ